MISSIVVSAQLDVEYLRFKNINTVTGLSNDWVNSIAEDSRGYIWSASRSGLNIFSGSKNEIISHIPNNVNSLSMNDVSEVLYSKHDVIIAGTWGGGINIVDPYTKEVYRPDANKEFSSLVVKSIVEDADSIVWIATYGNGLFKFDYKNEKFEKCTFKPSNNEPLETFDYCQDLCYHNDTIWITSRMGGLGYILASEDIISSELDNQNKPIKLGDITALIYHQNKLVLGTQTGDVYFYDINKKVSKTIFSVKLDDTHQNRLNAFSIDLNNNLWISTSAGLFKYSNNNKTLHRIESLTKGINYKDNFGSFVDSRGMIWFGNWGNGLYYYTEVEDYFHQLNLSEIELSRISSILPFRDSLFLLGTSNGLLGYNKHTGVIEDHLFDDQYSKSIMENIILGLAYFQDKIIVCVDAAGLFYLDPKDMSVSPVKLKEDTKFKNTSIIGVDKLKNGDLWIGSWSKGAVSMNENTGIQTEFFHDETDSTSIGCNTVFCVLQSNKDAIWVGTQDGLEMYNEGSFDEPNIDITVDGKPFEVRNVRALAEDNNGNLWAACLSGILKVDISNGNARLYSEESGLIENVVHSMIHIDGLIWATTKIGLIRIDVSTNEIQNFTSKDGLPANVFNDNGVYYSEDSTLYLANGKEIIYFEPHNLEKLKHKPSFYFEDFSLDDNIKKGKNVVDNRQLNNLSSLKLKYNQQNIAITVSILDFHTSKDSKFAYRLVGFDNKWIYQNYNNRMIRYTNLDPGKYQLEIAKQEEGGILSPVYKTMTFKIGKPFWKEWWFIALEFFIVISLIILIIRKRTIDVLKQNKELEAKVKTRTEEIRLQNNLLLQQGKAMESNVRYASLLQDSLLPNKRLLDEAFNKMFIFYRPKDVVSGDFYWCYKYGTKTILAVGDCTGHGVSGAFMSVLGITAIKTIVEVLNIHRPDLILNKLNEEINKTLRQDESNVNDGMDISIISYENRTNTLEFASAKNSLLIKTKDGLERFKGDRFPIGGASTRFASRKPYVLHKKKIEEKHTIYLYSDGFQDQFGAETNKKYMQKKFRSLIDIISENDISNQKYDLETEFDSWKQDVEQVDDVLVVGVELAP